MSNLVKFKIQKVKVVLAEIGSNPTEKAFIEIFKQRFPEDWRNINDRWESEENSTPPGKKHSMQHPDVYMHEMWRNQVINKTKKNPR